MDVVDVTRTTSRYVEKNLIISRGNTSVGKKFKRANPAASYRDIFVHEVLGQQKEIGIEQLLKIRSHHAKEMESKFSRRDVFYKKCRPKFYSTDEHDEYRYAFLDQGYFATLYDTHERVPVYSAYTLRSIERILGRYGPWHRNSGLLDIEQPGANDFNGISTKQLHRGHLYPQFYAAEQPDMKKYTNLITNMALQYARFNLNTWKRLELALHDASIDHCSTPGSKRFFLTGVIPSNPINENYFNHSNIPDYFWTAACCDTSDGDQNAGWSFAYMVRNEDEQRLVINLYLVDEFLRIPQMVGRFSQLFSEHCLFNPLKTIDVIKSITAKNEIDIFYKHGQLANISYEYGTFVKMLPLKRPRSG